jgi:hypothetical protein
MGAVITSSTNFHSHSFPAFYRAMRALSAVKESATLTTMARQWSTAVLTVAVVAVLIQAATPFCNCRMVSTYLEASQCIRCMPAD